MERIDIRNPVNWRNPLNKGLAAWWLPIPSQGWTGGDKLRDLCRKFDGTFVSSPTWGNGSNGFGAVVFDGTTEAYVDCGRLFGSACVSQTAHSVVIACKPAVATGRQYLYRGAESSTGDGTSLRLEFGTWAVEVDGTDLTGGVPTVASTLVGFSFTGGDLRLYINGQQIASSTKAFSGFAQPADWTLGLDRFLPSGFKRPFNGYIESVWVYNGAISGETHAKLYDQWRKGYPNTLKRLPRVWSFGVVSGGPATYSGTLTLTTPVTTAAFAGTFTKPTYSGVLSATSPKAIVAFAGTFATHTYSGVLSATSPVTTASFTGTFTKPTYSGVLSATVAATTTAYSGTFTKPTYSGVLNATSPRATIALVGDTTNPTYSGVLGATTPKATFAGSAIHAAAVFSGQLGLTVPRATGSFAGTFTKPTYSGALLVTTPRTTFAGVATNVPPTRSGVLNVSTPRVTFQGTATFDEEGGSEWITSVLSSRVLESNIFTSRVIR